MLKKLLATLILATSSTASFATNTFFYLAPTAALNTVTSSDSSFRGISPKLGLGVAAEYSEGFYIAGEINVLAGVWQLSDNKDNDTDTSAEICTSYDASILPGMMFSPNTLGFLRLGVVTSHFSGAGADSTGGEIGAGLQTVIRDCWYIRGEYIYSFYSTVGDLKAPKEDTFALSLVFAF